MELPSKTNFILRMKKKTSKFCNKLQIYWSSFVYFYKTSAFAFRAQALHYAPSSFILAVEQMVSSISFRGHFHLLYKDTIKIGGI